jgi:hypothetical protein
MLVEKTKYFKDVKFNPGVIIQARECLEKFLDENDRKYCHQNLSIRTSGEERWSHDNVEEFFADYIKEHIYSEFDFIPGKYRLRVNWDTWDRRSSVLVKALSRQQIEAIFHIFESNREKCKLPPLPKEERVAVMPRILIGHGRNDQWKELKDHLHDKHGYEVEAYEIGARVGHAIRDILQEMLLRSSFAIIVMTGEDEYGDGTVHARQNVIHELGLFQGYLGFSRAIVTLEEGTEEFSNIHGIHQIRFAKGNIKETFGEVLATLRREFNE